MVTSSAPQPIRCYARSQAERVKSQGPARLIWPPPEGRRGAFLRAVAAGGRPRLEPGGPGLPPEPWWREAPRPSGPLGRAPGSGGRPRRLPRHSPRSGRQAGLREGAGPALPGGGGKGEKPARRTGGIRQRARKGPDTRRGPSPVECPAPAPLCALPTLIRSLALDGVGGEVPPLFHSRFIPQCPSSRSVFSSFEQVPFGPRLDFWSDRENAVALSEPDYDSGLGPGSDPDSQPSPQH